MDELAHHDQEGLEEGLDHEDANHSGVTNYLARVSAWWIHVTGREGHEPMSYYDQ